MACVCPMTAVQLEELHRNVGHVDVKCQDLQLEDIACDVACEPNLDRQVSHSVPPHFGLRAQLMHFANLRSGCGCPRFSSIESSPSTLLSQRNIASIQPVMKDACDITPVRNRQMSALEQSWNLLADLRASIIATARSVILHYVCGGDDVFLPLIHTLFMSRLSPLRLVLVTWNSTVMGQLARRYLTQHRTTLIKDSALPPSSKLPGYNPEDFTSILLCGYPIQPKVWFQLPQFDIRSVRLDCAGVASTRVWENNRILYPIAPVTDGELIYESVSAPTTNTAVVDVDHLQTRIANMRYISVSRVGRLCRDCFTLRGLCIMANREGHLSSIWNYIQSGPRNVPLSVGMPDCFASLGCELDIYVRAYEQLTQMGYASRANTIRTASNEQISRRQALAGIMSTTGYTLSSVTIPLAGRNDPFRAAYNDVCGGVSAFDGHTKWVNTMMKGRTLAGYIGSTRKGGGVHGGVLASMQTFAPDLDTLAEQVPGTPPSLLLDDHPALIQPVTDVMTRGDIHVGPVCQSEAVPLSHCWSRLQRLEG